MALNNVFQLRPGLNADGIISHAIGDSGTPVTVSPAATASISVATEAPALVDEHTVSPTTAAITLTTEAPTMPVFETVKTPTEATIGISTEAPTASGSGEVTVTPTTVTIIVDTELPAVIPGEALRRYPIMLNYTRRWVYINEGYRQDVVYQRRYIVPMKPETYLSAAAEATISISTEAPTLSIEAVGSIAVTPVTADIDLVASPVGLFQINPAPAIISQPIKKNFVSFSVWRQKQRWNGVNYTKRIEHVTYKEHQIRRPRAIQFDYFDLGQRIITPITADIQVDTDAPTYTFAGVSSPSVNTIQITTQSPNILLDSASPLALEILIMSIASRRKRRKAGESNRLMRVEMPTKVITTYSEAKDPSLRRPVVANISLSLEAPTISAKTAISPTEATITVDTDTVTVTTQEQYQPNTAGITVLTEAPTIQTAEQAVSSEATITVTTEAPTVTGTIDLLTVRAGSAASIEVGSDPLRLSGLNTTVYPGGNGVDTTEVAVVTGSPVVYITKWVKESKPTSTWTKESAASNGWEKVARAANDWRSK